MLVLISIVSVLATLLFPVFVKALDSARRSQSFSNMRQIGASSAMYCSDYEDVLPMPTIGSRSRSDDYYWGDMIHPYAKDWRFLSAPGEPPIQFKTLKSSAASAGTDYWSQEWSYSYAINDVTADSSDCTPFDAVHGPSNPDCQHLGAAGKTTSSLVNSALTIWAVDNLPATEDTGDISTFIKPSNRPSDLARSRHVINWQVGSRDNHYLQVHGQSQDGYPRYLGGFTLVACDGHASFRKRERHAEGATASGGTEDWEWLANP